MSTCLINDNKNAIVQERTKIGFEWDSFFRQREESKDNKFLIFYFYKYKNI